MEVAPFIEYITGVGDVYVGAARLSQVNTQALSGLLGLRYRLDCKMINDWAYIRSLLFNAK